MDAHTEVRKLLDQIRVLTNNPVIIKASDQIEVICSSFWEPHLDSPAQKIGLRGVLASIFDLLYKRQGQAVSKEALHNVCCRQSDSESQLKTIDVQIFKLRKRLVGTQYENAIETVWGIGFKLVPVNKAGKPFIPYAERKECPRGHAYDEANTYISPKGMRVCRACRVHLYKERYKPKVLQRMAEYREKAKAHAA